MRSRPNKFSSRWILAQKNGQSGSYKLCEMKSRQVRFFLYWPVENVQFCIKSIGHLSNFPRFHKNVEVWKNIFEKSSPKESFWRKKRKKSEYSDLSSDFPYLQAMALKRAKLNPRINLFTNASKIISVAGKAPWHLYY